MKYYCVIDTNVIVSSMLKEESVPWFVVRLVLHNKIIPIINDEILKEYNEVLRRNGFQFDPNKIEKLINKFVESGISLERAESDDFFTDQDDKVFYEVVLTGRKSYDALLVTGNKRHYPLKTFVVTPREMLDIISKEN